MPPLPYVNGSANDGSGNVATLPCTESAGLTLSPIEIGLICDALKSWNINLQTTQENTTYNTQGW